MLVELKLAQILGRGGVRRTLKEGCEALDVAHILVRVRDDRPRIIMSLHPLA
jgi:hypothetical protein